MKLRWLLCLLFCACIHEGMAQGVGTWTNTGPVAFPVNVSGQINGIGRVCQIKFHPTNPQKLYAVSASGGLFISTDNGQNWTPTPGTEQLPRTACSSICIDYTNDNILYLSTGDPNYYNEDYGIWKSTDGGQTWNMANTNIGYRMAVEIIMDPNNHNNLVAATDDGIWKTTNAGATWTEQLNASDFKDMKMQPGSTNTLYAVTNSAYYKSTDMGSSWTQITNGINVPANNGGLRLAVSNANPNVVYICTTDGNGIVMRSSDAGQSFTTVYTSSTQCLVCYDENPASGSQGNYNFSMTANPQNANEVIIVAHCVWRSTDGGVTWSRRTDWYAGLHTDMHDIKYSPYNNQQRFTANDGGVWFSTDTAMSSWSPRSDGLAATEIYHAAQSPVIRQMISIGTQDNGELYFDNTWKCNRGGDWGAHNAFDYSSNAMVYYLSSGNRRTLLPVVGDQSFNSPFIPTDNAAIEFVPSMHNVCFIGNDSLWRSTNINATSPSWTLIRPSNTNEVILDIASCRADSNILYFVTDGSHLYRSTNALAGSPTFTALNTPGGTANAASIATDKNNANILYLSCNNTLYRSANQGASWTSLTSGLPNLNIRKVIHDDYSTTERIFVSMGSYVYYKTSTTSWTNTTGLPTIPNYSDFMIYNDSTAASIIRVSTYGRGVWECPIFNNLPPFIAFTADKQSICPADTVHFSKNIIGNTTSLLWSFPGGIPATSTADTPIVVYPAPGVYSVTLKVINQSTADSLVKSNYITVSNGQSTPLQQGFEGATYPPAGWLLASQSNNAWQRTDSAGGFGQSPHSIFYDNFNNDGGGKHDRIITPSLDLTNALSATLSFDVAYTYYTGYRDSLLVEISTDCGKTFVPVYEKDSTTLSTSGLSSNYFIPTATQWRKDTISLTPYLGNSIQIAFDNVGHYGQPIYIDNINIPIIPNSVNTVNKESLVQVYPNPTNGIVNIKGAGLSGREVTLNCYNIIGEVVRQKKVAIDKGVLNTTIDLSRLPAAVYELKIQAGDGSQYVKRVVLQ